MREDLRTLDMTYKVTIVGAFDINERAAGGQTVKTRELLCMLEQQLGNDAVTYVDTYGWKRNPIGVFFKFLKSSCSSENIIMLPAHKGVQIFSRMLTLAKKLFRPYIYYDVIGGWIAYKVKSDKRLSNILKNFDGIWVETSSMKHALEELDFRNVYVVNNFKTLKPVKFCEKYDFKLPYKLCTFSRVLREKGIEDAIDVVTRINDEKGTVLCTLDIFGKVDEVYIDSFNKLQSKFPSYIYYRGVVDSNKSVDVLKNYYLLLFPTHYSTEGIPGTIIDSFFAGLPVVSSRWNNFNDVIEEGSTGFGFEMNNNDDFYRVLMELLNKPNLILDCKKNCLIKSKEYSPKYVYFQMLQSGFLKYNY